MTIRDVPTQFPTLLSIFDEARFRDTLAKILGWATQDPRILTVPRKGHSRGFWNTVAMASVATEDIVLAALWRLSIIEAGLEQAKRVGQEKKFRAPLAQDEQGFDQAIAELFCIGALGPLFTTVALERPGSKKGKNYDLHLERGDDVIQTDVKWRTETPVGDGPPDLLNDLASLLGKDVTCTVYLVLKSKAPSVADRIRAACMIADCMTVQASPGDLVGRDAIGAVPEALRSQALMFDYVNEPFYCVVIGGVDSLFVPSDRKFYIADNFVDHIELSDFGATIVVVPKAETRAILAQSKSAALSFDYENPESWGIEALLSSVAQQLPSSGVNVPLLGLESRYSFEDAQYALLGEPDLEGHRLGGLFANATSLSAVVAFSLTPFGMDGAEAETAVKTFYNPNASTVFPPELASKLEDGLKAHAAKMVSEARRLKDGGT